MNQELRRGRRKEDDSPQLEVADRELDGLPEILGSRMPWELIASNSNILRALGGYPLVVEVHMELSAIRLKLCETTSENAVIMADLRDSHQDHVLASAIVLSGRLHRSSWKCPVATSGIRYNQRELWCSTAR